MKIGILTYHRSVNNGAVMQCYTLSKELKRRFPDATVEIIDYWPKDEAQERITLRNYLKSESVILSVKKALTLLKNPNMLRSRRKRAVVFQQALEKLPLSQKSFFGKGTEMLFEEINQSYDAVVVGSDAIWNYSGNPFPNAYFLSPALHCKKLSYAASCYGMDYLKNTNDRAELKSYLDAFNCIAVRDKATEDFVKWTGCEKTPMHVCDPTAFLDVNDLPVDKEALEAKMKKAGFDFSRETIGIMGNTKMLNMVRSFYGKKYQIITVYDYLADADVNLCQLSPYEWAYVFRYFKLTFTTFFHGTMLSLRNGVPLICVALETEFAKKHTPKTLDVLTRLGLQDWYFHTDYRQENLQEIKAKADELLTTQPHDAIIEAIEKEAQTAEPFFARVREIIEKSEGRAND